MMKNQQTTNNYPANTFVHYCMAEYTSSPFNHLLKKDSPWTWSSNVQAAFERLKQSLVTLPILATYDPSIPLGLACDASEKVLGACLYHIMEDGR